MSRALAAVAALALVASLGFSGPLARNARASDCSWQRHSKRVVKHVRREGKPKRIVRTRHWWFCEPLATPPALAATPLPPPAAEPGPAPEPAAPTIGRLGVKAEDKAEGWSFTLSHPSLPPGEVIVELDNESGDPHNLNLLREGDSGPPLEVSEAGPKEHRTGRFTLPAGTYQLWCSLPEHEEKGMHTTLVVAGG